MDKNVFGSADLAELNSDHQAVWDHVIGAPPYGRSEQNDNGITSPGYRLGRRYKIDSQCEETVAFLIIILPTFVKIRVKCIWSCKYKTWRRICELKPLMEWGIHHTLF